MEEEIYSEQCDILSITGITVNAVSFVSVSLEILRPQKSDFLRLKN